MAVKRMLVALWLRQTANDGKDDKGSRMAQLEKALEEAERCRHLYVSSHQFPADEWGDPQLIFVAPEYLFSHPVLGQSRSLPNSRKVDLRAAGAQRYLSEKEANSIFLELKSLSRKYPQLLIVPGTIAWRKELKDYRNFRGLPEPAPPPDKVLEEAYAKLHPELFDPKTHVFKGDVSQDTGAGPSTMTWKAKYDAVKVAQKDGIEDFGLCLNTAPLLHAGERVLIYHKHGDFYELTESYDVHHRLHEIAFPGRKDGRFEIDGVQYGIEICFDHALGALADAEAERTDPHQAPHVHIITSASVDVQKDHCVVREGGYVVGAAAAGEFFSFDDKVYQGSGVWRFEAGNRVPVPKASFKNDPKRLVVNGPVAGSPFLLYAIRLDA